MGVRDEVMEIKKNLDEIKEQGFAMEILSDYKKSNKRMFIALMTVIFMWFGTIAYLVYILNDIGVVETTVTQENTDGYNNYIGNDGEITNGETND